MILSLESPVFCVLNSWGTRNMATAYKCGVWCVMRGWLRPCPHRGLLLLCIDSMLNTRSCLCMLAMADSISGSGQWFPTRHCCGGPVGVPWWLCWGCWSPYRTPVIAVDCWSIPVRRLMPAVYGSLVELGLVFSLYAGPPLTHKWTVGCRSPSCRGRPSSWCGCLSILPAGSEGEPPARGSMVR